MSEVLQEAVRKADPQSDSDPVLLPNGVTLPFGSIISMTNGVALDWVGDGQEDVQETVQASLQFAFDPTQKRGRDGRWVKYIFGAKGLMGLFNPSPPSPGTQNMLASARGKEFRDYKRGKVPSNRALKETLEWVDYDLDEALNEAPPTPDNALVWYRPNIWYKDADFPTDPAIGDVITDSAPITTEYEKPPAAAPFKYAIRVPAGTERTLAIPPLGEYKADKGGMLIGDGTQFKVADVEVDGRGRKTILLDVLEPSEQVQAPTEPGVTTKTPAPSAEEAIEELRRLLGEPVGTPDEIPDWERELLDPNRGVPKPVPVIEDPNAPKPPDEPFPPGLRRTPPAPESLAAWKKKPPPTPAEVAAAKAAIEAKHGKTSWRTGSHVRGKVDSAALLDAAGYNGKPTVLSPAEFDAFSGKVIPYFNEGPRETFIRAGYGTKMYDNITADEEYFIGRGIFGNGTFMGGDKTAEAFGGWRPREVKRTMRKDGREAIRLKIHPDAVIADWPDLPESTRELARRGDVDGLERWAVDNGVDVVNTSLGHYDYMAGVNVVNRAVLIVEELV